MHPRSPISITGLHHLLVPSALGNGPDHLYVLLPLVQNVATRQVQSHVLRVVLPRQLPQFRLRCRIHQSPDVRPVQSPRAHRTRLPRGDHGALPEILLRELVRSHAREFCLRVTNVGDGGAAGEDGLVVGCEEDGKERALAVDGPCGLLKRETGMQRLGHLGHSDWVPRRVEVAIR